MKPTFSAASKLALVAPSVAKRSAMPKTISYVMRSTNTHNCSVQKSPVTRALVKSVSTMDTAAVHANSVARCVNLPRCVMNPASPANIFKISCFSFKKSHHGASLPVRQSKTPYPNTRAMTHHGTPNSGFLLGNTRTGGGHVRTAAIKRVTANSRFTVHAKNRMPTPAEPPCPSSAVCAAPL